MLSAGAVVDRYTVEGVIGRGGMAMVYRVRHHTLGSAHALKVLAVPAESVRERFLLEGRVQAALRHPNICAVTDVVEVAGAPGLILELVDGPGLDELVAAAPLDDDTIRGLGNALIGGVAFAHGVGLVHRDLKPANVLLQHAEGMLVPKVTDFGLAKLFGWEGEESGGRTRSGVPMGTPAYMAPEQIRDAKTIDRRADIWALGAVLYELATGRRAFPGDDVLVLFNAIAEGRFVPPRDLRPDLPEAFERAILGALVPDREGRWPDCDHLRAAWLGLAPGDVLPAASVGVPTPRDLPERMRARATSIAPAPTARPKTSDQTWSAVTAADLSVVGVSQPPPAPRGRLRGRSLAAGLVGGALAASLAWVLLTPSAPAPPPAPAAPRAAAVAELAAPAVVVPAAPSPAPTAPEAAPEAAPVAAALPVPAAAVVAPLPDAPPTPPEAAPPARDPNLARVTVTGDAKRVWLEGPGGRYPAGGDVPAGTWKVIAFFDEVESVPTGTLELRPGDVVELRCSASLQKCR